MSPATPFDLPLRTSLAAQVAASIRKSIEQGTWDTCLPSERRLCELLHVSRPTVRAGLRMLAGTGIIEISQGRRVRILGTPGQPVAEKRKLVGLITHEPIAHLTSRAIQLLSGIRAQLSEQGFAMESFVCAQSSVADQRRRLQAFIRQGRVFCCVLLSVSRELQVWFATQSIPALVLGSCHPSVRLPSLDVDHRAVCRHAAGVFLAKGHRQVALIVPNSGIAGYLASEDGFREGMERHGPDARGIVVRHTGSAQSISARLDVLFKSPHPPTALLVAKPQDVFLVIIHLLRRGLAVPDTVSLIARDHDHIFEIAHPAISHYSYPNESFVQTLARLLLRLVNEGFLNPEPTYILPKFVSGGTVKPLS
ncbi:MAG: substrate-binding domain-containing protein [Opitutaceae bacterium]|nr:substrate-binding domain-containing protein [Opitutaceae bacterium]